MAAERGGVSSRGRTNTHRAGYLLPFPCKSEPAAASWVSPGSSPTHSKASRASSSYAAEANPKPEVEASAGEIKKTLLAISATEGRGGRCDSRPAPYNGAGSLTHHRSASPSPCIRGGDGYREPHGGEDASSSFTRRLEKRQGRLPTRADFMKPSSTLENIKFQTSRHPSLLDRRGAVNDWRFPKARGKGNEICDKNNWQNDTVSSCMSSGSNHIAISMKPSATQRNIKVETPSHGSLLDRRADGANQVPPRSIHKAAPARLMHQAPSHNCRQYVDVIDAINDDIVTKVSKEDDEVDEQDWQTDTMSTRTSSARYWNLESSAMPRNIRLQIPRNHSLLDRRVDRINQVPFMCRGSSSDNYHHCLSALDASDEWRLHKGCACAVTAKCLEQRSSTASKSSKTAPGILGKVKDKVATVRSTSAHTSGGTVGARKKEAYITTLGAGGGYGDPHPPPFYKCKDCIETSKCLDQSSSAVWESINSSGVHLEKDEATSAEKDEATSSEKDKATSTDTDWTSGGTSIWNWEDECYTNTLGPGGGYGYPHPPPFYKCEVCRKRTAFYRIKCCLLVVCEHCSCKCDPVEDEALQEQDHKEELPEVKLEGSDLFLWQQCSFPAELMLCLARRTGDHLRYYFAHVSDLMDPEVQIIPATVYNFRLQGRNASSLTVSYEFLTRSELAHG